MTHAVFHAASRVVRRVANETAMDERPVSVLGVAVAEFARQIFERFEDKHVLVIGAGEIADETMRHLKEEGVREVMVIDRNVEEAAKLAHLRGGRVKSWSNLFPELASTDLVVTATEAPEAILTLADFDRVARTRRGRTLIVLDLAVPRVVEPEIGNRPGVYLYCVDDLQAICERNRRERQNGLPKALQIVDEETDRFMADLRFREADSVIGRLRRTREQPQDEDLRRLWNKLPYLDARARQEIERLFDRLTNKLFHVPLESLRQEYHHGVPTALLQSLGRQPFP